MTGALFLSAVTAGLALANSQSAHAGIIYADHFARGTPKCRSALNGSKPAPTDLPDATWHAASNLTTDGTRLDFTGSGSYGMGLLPIAPVYGDSRTYTLFANLTPKTSRQCLGLGFTGHVATLVGQYTGTIGSTTVGVPLNDNTGVLVCHAQNGKSFGTATLTKAEVNSIRYVYLAQSNGVGTVSSFKTTREPSHGSRRASDAQRNINAVQTVYRKGVPQIDAHGRLLLKYDPNRSIFPIGIWGVPPPGKSYGYKYEWSVPKKAGFNTGWAYSNPAENSLKAAGKFGFHVVLMGAKTSKVLGIINDNPNLLGNVWTDEPIGKIGTSGFNMERFYRRFLDYKKMAHEIAPNLLVFVNDCAWIMLPATAWWIKWNNAGDVSCDDDYPVMTRHAMARSIGAEPNGIPQVVSLEVASNKQREPVWLIVGAFDQKSHRVAPFPFSFPSVTQLRAEVYAGIISGATGINYFIWDGYISRDASVIGVSPDPQVAYNKLLTRARPMQLIQSRELWDAATRINHELAKLTPEILSPTVGSEVDYKVKISGKSVTDTPIRCLLKPDPAGGYVLFTVNLDDAVLNVSYTFPAPLREVGAMFENQLPRKFDPPAKNLSVHYEPFETHVMRVIPVDAKHAKEHGKRHKAP